MSEAQRMQNEMNGLVEIYRLKGELLELRDERDRLRRDYDELIMAVGNKYPGETRHQTALRYIQRAEEPSNIPEQAAMTPAGGGQDGR